ncbi:MAG: tRNA preQ1(34) S-adenosylmethionine ribosyltransferase-isomerase QueA [Longimicrobiales bacterium]|nr:tRNA preQ1(34) S-adenosylmethionine ribosyltransferase-isomerase QueA [Longimicrobiales bacterium]
MKTSDFDYDLPEGCIARYPAERRDDSRLLALPRNGGTIRHLRFSDLPELLEPADVLVLNESRVLPARLLGEKPTGARAEILLLRPHAPEGGGPEPEISDEWSEATLWEALVRPGSKLKPGRRVVISPELEVAILDSTPENGRVVRLETELTVAEALERYGHMPLPPYLDREDEPLDRSRYQTVYARRTGSVAAPTAGLHFTESLLERIRAKGVSLARITLHVGVGTFRPVEEEDPEDHPMHAEVYEVSPTAATAINQAREAGGRVWAVGTTVVRTLESVAAEDGTIGPERGSTDLFIAPGHDFRAVDALVTNFHLPRSTLLMLVSAFGGRERVMEAYGEAIREGYRFYSYGDAMALY